MPKNSGSIPTNLSLSPGQSTRVNAEDTGWETFTPGGGPHTHPESDVINLVDDLAGKEPANSNIQTHITSTANPHATTASQVGALATTAFVGLAKITVAADAPVGPSTNDLWIDI